MSDEETDDLVYPISPIAVTSEKVCVALALTEKEPTLEQIDQAYNLIEIMRDFVKNAQAHFKAVVIAYLKNNGSFTLGSKEFFLGETKKVQPKALEKVLDAILVKVGGDIQEAAGYVSINGFLPGKCKKLFADEPGRFEELFEEKKSDAIKEKELQILDTRFLK